MDNNVKTALIIGGTILVFLFVLPAVFGATSTWQGGGWGGMMGPGMMGPGMMGPGMMGPGMMGPGMMGPWMMGGFGGMWLGPILWAVILGLSIWAVIALVRGVSQPSGSDSSSNRPDSALEVLKRRYARGEISNEEFEEKKNDLV